MVFCCGCGSGTFAINLFPVADIGIVVVGGVLLVSTGRRIGCLTATCIYSICTLDISETRQSYHSILVVGPYLMLLACVGLLPVQVRAAMVLFAFPCPLHIQYGLFCLILFFEFIVVIIIFLRKRRRKKKSKKGWLWENRAD